MFLDSFNSEPNSFTAPTTLGHRQEETDDVNFHKYISSARRTYVRRVGLRNDVGAFVKFKGVC